MNAFLAATNVIRRSTGRCFVSLTSHLKQLDSPVRQFLVERFPHTQPVVEEVKSALEGASTIRPDRVPWSLLGIAIDHRLRGYFEPVSFSGIPEEGAQRAWGIDGFDFRWSTGTEMDRQSKTLRSVGRRLERDEEEWLARFCIVLSFFDLAYRQGRAPSDLTFLSLETVTADQLLEIPQQSWVDDLCTLSWAFYDNHAELLSKPAVLNPTFVGSRDVGGADADLVLDGCLLEIKSTVKPGLEPMWLYQLLGYVLLDYRNRLGIDAVGVYFARQARLIQWPLEELMRTTGGADLSSLRELRDQFKRVARGK